MAITWDVKITPIDVPNYTASIKATRTDSDDPDNPMVYHVSKATIETGPQQVAVMDEIWAKHQSALSKNTAIATFVSDREAAGKAYLEARE